MKIEEAEIRRVFRLSLWLKGAHSITEVVAGLALVFASHEAILRLADALTRGELIEDSQDLVAKTLEHLVTGFSSGSQAFAAYYLLSHGLIKLVLVTGVLAGRLWAYPAFIAAMIGFIVYQAYKLFHQVTILMVVITILDFIVLVLAWHEYGYIRRQRTS